MTDWAIEFYQSGRLEWVLEIGRELGVIASAFGFFVASRFVPIRGFKVVFIGLLFVCCEQMMHAAADIGHRWPREVPLAMSWVGWGTTLLGARMVAMECAAILGTAQRRINRDD